jgi:carboxymethylenebutenolidase
MGGTVTVKAIDDHVLSVYVAQPTAEPIAGLVVIQEIFGVNRHIRSIADSYAKDGFFAVAPALFDRIEPGVEFGYDASDGQRGRALLAKLDLTKALADVDAALGFASNETHKKVGVIGYCFGGLLAWLTATRLRPNVAVGYYAGRIGDFASEMPKVPVQLHFGRLDAHIPAEQVEKVKTAHPEVEIHWYEGAGHGFNCDMRASYHTESAALARSRALTFLKRNLL